MPSPQIAIVYPLDLTGTASSNLITGEVHDLSGLPATQNRAFVLNYGPFFTDGLIVKNNADGTVLTPATVNNPNGQYVATQLFVDATLRTGKDICSVIVITDTTLPAGLQVSVTAQMLGGDYSASVDAIQQLIDGLQLGNQPVTWAGILGKPVLFPPAPHLHDLGDVYGFEYMIAALERIVQAIYIGDTAQLNAIYQYIDHEVAGLQTNISTVAQNLTVHLADHTNPHQVTAAQVGLGNVQNYGVASTAQAQAGVATNVYMTPQLVQAAVASQVGNAFQAHLTNYSNPHQVTATQVNLGNVQNYGIATIAQAQAGTINTAYLTPQQVAAAVTTQALAPLNAHINNTSNPHLTTKSQVGLSSVQNYGIATTTDAQNGVSNVLYMTPQLVAAAVQFQVGNTLTAHINNTSNPHATTAAQVGLGNVNNTSDINKPISTATQSALNTKATLNTPVQFTGVYLSAAQDVYLYESSAGSFTVRTGTGGAWKYSTFDSAGNLSISGQMSAATFKPSDIALKDSPEIIEARPLWRQLDFWKWLWNEKSGNVGASAGTMADDVKRAGLTEYLSKFKLMLSPGNPDQGIEAEWSQDYDCVDYQSMAFEMALAAGREIDRLSAQVKALLTKVKE
jgi:hypothetical protein